MKNKLFLILLLLLITSCGHIEHKEDFSAGDKCKDKSLSELYFSDWDSSLKCAHFALRKESGQHLQLANFILGEEKFLDADDSEAFNYFIHALDGSDPSISEASLSYIKKINLSFDQIKTLTEKDTGNIKDTATRLSIDLERIKWALATDRKKIFNKIISDITIPGKLRFRAEKDSIALKNRGVAVDPGDYFSNVEARVFHLSGDFYLEKDTDLSVFVKTLFKHRIFIDGKAVNEKESLNSLFFSKGNHNLTVKFAAGEEKNGDINIFLPFYDSKVTEKKDGGIEGTFAFIEKEPEIKTPFNSYIDLLTDTEVSTEKYFKIYSSVLGSFSPPFIYNLALRSFEERSAEKGLSYLHRIIERKKYLRPIIEIKAWLLYSGRKKELETFIESYPIKTKNIYSRFFELDKLSFEKQYLAGMIRSKKLFEEFKNYPASYYYYAGSLEEFGDLNGALDLREELLRLLPFHMPLLSSIEELAEQLQKNRLEEMVIKRKLERSPQKIKLKLKFAKLYFIDRKYEKAQKIYDEILRSIDSNLSALIGKGNVAFISGDLKKAEKYYLKAFHLYPESPIASKKASLFKDTDCSTYFEKYSMADKEIKKLAMGYDVSSEFPYTVVFDEGNYKIVNHNLIISRFRILVKINARSAIDEFKKTKYSGDLISARILRKDGSVIKAQKIEKGVIDFSALQVGDFIDYSFVTKVKNDYWLNGFNDMWLFGDFGTQYEDSKVSVYVPDGMKFNYYISKSVEDPDVKMEDGGNVYIFQKKKTQLPPKEEFMPADIYKVIPNLQFSVINSWQDFAKWQISFIREGKTVTRSIEEKTFSLISREDNQIAITKKIRDFVANEIRYRSIDPGELRVRPESAEETLKRMSGDCKDKALLMKTMLKIAGIESGYALVRSGFSGALIEEVPSMQFDHALVYITPQQGIESEGFFVDPTSGYDSFSGINHALIGVKAMVINESESTFRFIKVEENVKGTADFLLNFSGRSSVSFSGTSASMIRFDLTSGKTPAEILGRFFLKKEGESSEIGQVEIKEGKLKDPLKLEFEYQGSFPSVAASIYGFVDKKRYYPLELPYLSQNMSFTFKTDKKISYYQSNRFFNYSAKNTENGVVKVDFVIKKWTIDSDEFAELEKYVINVMMFERKMKEGADG